MLIGSLLWEFRRTKKKKEREEREDPPVFFIAIQPLICTFSVTRIAAVAGSWHSKKGGKDVQGTTFLIIIIFFFFCKVFTTKQEYTHHKIHKNRQRHVHIHHCWMKRNGYKRKNWIKFVYVRLTFCEDSNSSKENKKKKNTEEKNPPLQKKFLKRFPALACHYL